MKKLIIFCLIILVTGCFNNELPAKEFEQKNLKGTYYATYISEETNLESEIVFELDEKRNIVSELGTSKVEIDKKYNLNGLFKTADDQIEYEGVIEFEGDKITAKGTWKSNDDKGTWQVEKGLPNPNPIEEEIEEEVSPYNKITEDLVDLTTDQRSLMVGGNAPIAGGHLQFFEQKNETIMGAPTEQPSIYSVGIYTSTGVEDVRSWLYDEVLNLGWKVFENYDFDDGYGSFNIILERDDSLKRMYVGATTLSNYTFITIKFI